MKHKHIAFSRGSFTVGQWHGSGLWFGFFLFLPVPTPLIRKQNNNRQYAAD